MAKQQRPSLEQLLRKSLGRKAAEALLAKIDRMVDDGASAAAIEKAVTADLQKEFVQQVVSATVSEIGPVAPSDVRAIKSNVKPVVRAIVARIPSINRGIVATTKHRPTRSAKR